MTKQLEKLMDMIIDAQIKYHITGGYRSEYDHMDVSHETKAGNTIQYTAGRDCSSRGLSYTLWMTETSIAKGHKISYIGQTHEFGRESVVLI